MKLRFFRRAPRQVEPPLPAHLQPPTDAAVVDALLPPAPPAASPLLAPSTRPAPEVPPQAPRRAQRRGHDFAALTLPADRLAAASSNPTQALQVLEALHAAHPRAPQVLVRLAILRDRHGDSAGAKHARQALMQAAPAALDRAIAWAELYFNRHPEPAHSCLKTSAEELLTWGGAFELSSLERRALLTRVAPGVPSLLHRATAHGGVRDISQVLKVMAPCKVELQKQLDDALPLALARSGTYVLTTLLKHGAHTDDPALLEHLTQAALDCGSAELLTLLLARLIAPARCVLHEGRPASLLQMALHRGLKGHVEALLLAGALVYDSPADSALASAPLLAAQRGPHMLRILVRAGLPLDAQDPYVGTTPLAQAAHLGRADAMETLLYCGASWDDPAAARAATAPACKALLAKARRVSETAGVLANALKLYDRLALKQTLWKVPEAPMQTVVATLQALRAQLSASAETPPLLQLVRAVGEVAREPEHLASLPSLCWGLRSATTMANVIEGVQEKVHPFRRQHFIDSLPRLPEHLPEAQHVHVLDTALRIVRKSPGDPVGVAAAWRPMRTLPLDGINSEMLTSMMWDFSILANCGGDVAALAQWGVADAAKNPGPADRTARMEKKVIHFQQGKAPELHRFSLGSPDAVPRTAPLAGQAAEAGQNFKSEPEPKPESAALGLLLDAHKRLAREATVEVPLVAWPSPAADKLALIEGLHTALNDEEVLEQLAARPLATQYLALLNDILGEQTVDALFSAQPPNLMPLKRLLAKVHPDKAPQAKEWASALTQLLNGLRDVLQNPALVASLAAARPC